MAEIIEWVGLFLRAVLGTIFMLAPGIVFWLVVVGIVAAIWWVRHAGLLRGDRDVDLGTHPSPDRPSS